MPASATITQINKLPNGSIHTQFSDGSGNEFADLNAAHEFVRELETTDNAQRLLFGKALAVSPDLSNVSSVIGKTLMIDLASNNPLGIQ